jgi:hypothetical protein
MAGTVIEEEGTMETYLATEYAKSIMPDLEMDDVYFGQLIALAVGLFLACLGRVICVQSLPIFAP